MGKLLSETTSKASAESHKSKGMNSLTFFFPSFRSELIWIFEVFLAEMVTPGLRTDYSVLYDRDVFDIMVLCCTPLENSICRPKKSCRLVLYPINIYKLLQVFICDICIWFDDWADLLSNLSVNFGVLSEIVNDHSEEVSCCVCSRNWKCLKLI